MMNRLTEDWPVSILSADAANRYELRTLRARSRDLERNGGIAERYLSAVEMNVIGSDGVGLQMKARKSDARTATGITSDFDSDANRLIEKEWDEFGKRGNFDVTGKHSRKDFWRLALRTAARDGDALILFIAANVPNCWRIAFQFGAITSTTAITLPRLEHFLFFKSAHLGTRFGYKLDHSNGRSQLDFRRIGRLRRRGRLCLRRLAFTVPF
jgi:capsid protein